MTKKRMLCMCVTALLCLIPLIGYAGTAERPGRVLQPVGDLAGVQDIVVDESLLDNKRALLDRVLRTLYYLETDEAAELYTDYFNDSIHIDSVKESLHRFFLILLLSQDIQTFTDRLRDTFSLYKSVGQDGRGTVRFTGYFQPVYQGSRERTAEYRYPLFEKPADFDTWAEPHPTRVALEGFDGQGSAVSPVAGAELVWLRSRFDVFMVHVQGSAIIELPDGESMAVGFAAGTNHPFRGISGAFLREHNVAWHRLGDFFTDHPALLNTIMARNNRFIFFEKKDGPAAVGSLGVPVLAERTIATDRLKLPPGAVALIRTKIPRMNKAGKMILRDATRFVLNLDTGSALKGPGRVDIFMGTGEEARLKASSVYSTGELYYLFLARPLKETAQPRPLEKLS